MSECGILLARLGVVEELLDNIIRTNHRYRISNRTLSTMIATEDHVDDLATQAKRELQTIKEEYER